MSELRWWARRWIEDQPHSGMDIDSAMSSMTELVTNSLRYAPGAVEVALTRGSLDELRISVRDSSDYMPRHQQVAADAGSGRGIAVMASLANRWGVSRHADGGKTVWCEFH
ncbi:MAG: ATP-binding protein [Chloroflexota bacterium]